MSGTAVLLEYEPNNTPASGNAAMGVDVNNHLWTLNNSGNIWMPSLTTASKADQTATSTEAIFSSLNIPLGLWQAGSTVRFTVEGTAQGVSAETLTFNFRAGTTGTTSDASVASVAIPGQTGMANTPFILVFTYTCRTTGAPGTGSIQPVLYCQGAGFGPPGVLSSGVTNVGPPTTTATVLSLGVSTNFTSNTISSIITEFLPV